MNIEKWVVDWFFSNPMGMYKNDRFLYEGTYQKLGQELKRREKVKAFLDPENYSMKLPEYILY